VLRKAARDRNVLLLSEAEVTAHRVRNIGQLHVVEHLLDAPAKAPVLMKTGRGERRPLRISVATSCAKTATFSHAVIE
jgi:hypothetical protein